MVAQKSDPCSIIRQHSFSNQEFNIREIRYSKSN